MRQSQTWLLRSMALVTIMPAMVFAQQPTAPARDYPSRPIRFVVPFPAGGSVDVIGRLIGEKMSQSLGQNFLIDNRPGAGGAIAGEFVAKSRPDGYTMLLHSSAHVILPTIVKKLPFDPIKDFMPVTLVVNSVGFILVANPSVPARSVKAFIALAKARTGKINYGSSGIGSAPHLAMESFSVMAGIKLMHVPYKGEAQSRTDLLGGQIDAAFSPPTTVRPLIKGGRLLAPGIGALQRWNGLPEGPTIDEAGVKGYKFVPFYGLWFPAGTPMEYVNLIQGEVAKAMMDPEVRQRFPEEGFAIVASKPEEFAKTIQEEFAFNRQLTEKIGIVPQ